MIDDVPIARRRLINQRHVSTVKVFPREQNRGKTLQKLTNDYGVVAGEAAGEVASAGLVAVVASGEAAVLGAAVSVFCSQAASNAAPARMQIYFFIGLDQGWTVG